jgi:hypothetical protein
MPMPMSMPSTYSINFNIPNENSLVPPYAQTPIRMNPINPITQVPTTQVPIVQMPMPYGPQLYAPYQPNINKKYDVRISTGDLSNIRHIYQDMLPKKDSNFPDRYATIIERVNIANYYNSILQKYYNVYDNITLIDDIKKNAIKIKTTDNNLSHLFGHIKIIDTDFLNILKGATENFIIFNVCFPIKYDNKHITCADESLRANLRIYNILTGNNREICNEIEYYNKIDKLIKNKNNPNFVLSYGTFVTPLNIDFKTINELTNINNLSKIQNKSNGNCLFILTESVNYTIVDWVTKKYTDSIPTTVPEVTVSAVTSSGTHNQETYKSVIFQLLVAIYFLKINDFDFKNFSLNNVFIKTINITPPNIQYWKYIINGIEYYVPNHGFLVMIDKKFDSDVDKGKLDTSDILQEIKDFITKNNISSINTFDNKEDIIKSINKHFGSYIYEKIGHIIPVSEIEKNEYELFRYDKKFMPGDLVLFTKYTNMYIISTYLGPKTKNNHDIYTNNSEFNKFKEDNIKLEVVDVSDDLIIKFEYKTNKKIIETYYIS